MAAPPLPPPPTQTATPLARSYDSKTGLRRNFIERDNVKHNLDGEELTRRFYFIMKSYKFKTFIKCILDCHKGNFMLMM